ncbi:type II secretion system F family protein [Acetobacteraceae bacterium]|nr:type II secretion system F family protein [Candidatus Parcubacteria bacterium]
MNYLKLQFARVSQLGSNAFPLRPNFKLPPLPFLKKLPQFKGFKQLTPKEYKKIASDLYEKLLNYSTPRFSLKEQMFFARRLAFLINAGVPLIEGLHIMRAQARRGGQARMLDHVLKDISNGQSLSKSFGKFPRVFGNFTISILKIGESSGTLSICLNYLADELKKRQILSRKVISAFIYPAVITLATIGITAFLMLYLFPKIIPIFTSLNMELPLTTRIVMAASVFMQHWGLLVMVGVVLVGIATTILLRRSQRVHFYFDHALVRTPLMGTIVRYYNIANTTRTLGLLLRSGVKLSDALPIVADTTKNLVYRAQLHELGEVVNRGEKISTHLIRETRYFPPIVGHMIAVGERSGTLSETLVYLSELYEHEVDEFTKNLSTLVEPALMIVMGVVVGFIAVSIITPIYGITQNLHP